MPADCAKVALQLFPKMENLVRLCYAHPLLASTDQPKRSHYIMALNPTGSRREPIRRSLARK